KDMLVGVDVLVHEVGELVHVHPRLLGILEFHHRAPLWLLATRDCILARRPMAVGEFPARSARRTRMTDVIYRIPTWLLGVLIVGLAAGLSALGLVVVHRFVPVESRRSHNDVAGYLSNIAAFVYAVLLAFIAVAVWQDYGNAQSTAQLEANAASDVFRQAAGYPEPFRGRVREGIRIYIEAVMRQWAREGTGK